MVAGKKILMATVFVSMISSIAHAQAIPHHKHHTDDDQVITNGPVTLSGGNVTPGSSDYIAMPKAPIKPVDVIHLENPDGKPIEKHIHMKAGHDVVVKDNVVTSDNNAMTINKKNMEVPEIKPVQAPPAPKIDFRDASSYDIWMKVISPKTDEDYHLMNMKTNGISTISATTEHAYPSNIVNIVSTENNVKFEEQKTVISHYLTGFIGAIKFIQPNELCNSGFMKKSGTELINALPQIDCETGSKDGRVHVTTNLAYHYVSGSRERDSDVSPVNGKVLKYELPDESRIGLQEDFVMPESGGIELYNGTSQDGPIHIYMMVIPKK